jgi:hypothetical protein
VCTVSKVHPECEMQVAPVMMPDNASSDCLICHRMFSIILRKHHCRNCGDLVCDNCSKSRWKLDDGAEPVRVCDKCIKTISPLLAPSRQTSPSFAISASRLQTGSRHVYTESMPTISEAPPFLVNVPQGADTSASMGTASQLPLTPRSNSSDDPLVVHGVAAAANASETYEAAGLGTTSDPTCIPAAVVAAAGRLEVAPNFAGTDASMQSEFGEAETTVHLQPAL